MHTVDVEVEAVAVVDVQASAWQYDTNRREPIWDCINNHVFVYVILKLGLCCHCYDIMLTYPGFVIEEGRRTLRSRGIGR